MPEHPISTCPVAYGSISASRRRMHQSAVTLRSNLTTLVQPWQWNPPPPPPPPEYPQNPLYGPEVGRHRQDVMKPMQSVTKRKFAMANRIHAFRFIRERGQSSNDSIADVVGGGPIQTDFGDWRVNKGLLIAVCRPAVPMQPRVSGAVGNYLIDHPLSLPAEGTGGLDPSLQPIISYGTAVDHLEVVFSWDILYSYQSWHGTWSGISGTSYVSQGPTWHVIRYL